jgi:hypothetical protein
MAAPVVRFRIDFVDITNLCHLISVVAVGLNIGRL